MTRRKITLASGVWEWFVGKTNVLIWSPSGEKHVTNMSKVTGLSWNAIERGKRKNTPSGWLCPSHIRAYIEANLV
jgi:hypothetical protein